MPPRAGARAPCVARTRGLRSSTSRHRLFCARPASSFARSRTTCGARCARCCAAVVPHWANSRAPPQRGGGRRWQLRTQRYPRVTRANRGCDQGACQCPLATRHIPGVLRGTARSPTRRRAPSGFHPHPPRDPRNARSGTMGQQRPQSLSGWKTFTSMRTHGNRWTSRSC